MVHHAARSLVIVCPILVCSLHAPVARAQSDEQEIVISATRIETPIDKVASSISVLHGETLREEGKKTVADALREVPGAEVVRSGGLGGNVAVFLRGANSEHTLVLIDGVEANNPISNARFFNFADLTLDNVDRIEVLRGPQSTLYGSDAMGGVINIITTRGKGDPSAELSAEAGSYDSFHEYLSTQGASGVVHYSLSGSQENSHNISSADASFGNREKDHYENTGFSGSLGANWTDTFSTTLTGRGINAHTDLDNEGGLGGDDPNRLLRNRQYFTRAEAKAAWFDKRLEQTFAVDYSAQRFDDNNDPDMLNPLMRLRSNFDGRFVKFENQNDFAINQYWTAVLGLETEQDRAHSTIRSESEFGPFVGEFPQKDVRTNGYYSEAQYDSANGFVSSFGVRLDDHEKFGNKVTWRIAPAYKIDSTDTKFSSTIGTGFKAPSLYQLYSEFGSERLGAERSLGLDAGVEQGLLNSAVHIGATFFWNRYKNLITFDPGTFVFENVGAARTDGLESFVRWDVTEACDLGVNYTYTDTNDQDTGESLLRRARNTFTAYLTYRPWEKFSVRSEVVAVGRRADNDFSSFPPSRVRLGGYATVNLALNYTLSKQLDLFARIENLFDKEYEEVYGFGSFGAAGYGGIRVHL